MIHGLSTTGIVCPTQSRKRIGTLTVNGASDDYTLSPPFPIYKKCLVINYPNSNVPLIKVLGRPNSAAASDTAGMYFFTTSGQCAGRIYPNGSDDIIMEAGNGGNGRGQIRITGNGSVTLDAIQGNTYLTIATGGTLTYRGNNSASGFICTVNGLELGIAATETTRILKAIDASGSNIAGNSLIVAGGKSTGSGAGGDLKLQVSPAGSAGSSLNTFVTAVTISSVTQNVLIMSSAATIIPLCVKGAASQSGDLLKITNSSDVLMFNFNAAGRMNIGATTIDTLGRQINIVAATPGIGLFENDVTTDQGGWDMAAAASVFTFRCFNNAISAANNIFTVSRTGYVPGTWRLYCAAQFDGNVTHTDATNIILGTTTGTKIGTGTTQKLGFWNATPVVQNTGWTTSNVTPDKVLDANSTTLDELADIVGTLIDTLKTCGILGA